MDPDFGPLIVVGAGGINVELYKDVAVRIAPIGEAEALEALAATRISRVLDGWRGAPPADRRRLGVIRPARGHLSDRCYVGT